MLEEILGRLSPANHSTAVELAALPLEIRGFGHVKEANLARAKAKEAALLAASARHSRPRSGGGMIGGRPAHPVSSGSAIKRELPSRSTRTSTFLRPFFLAAATFCCTSSGAADGLVTDGNDKIARAQGLAPPPGLFCGTSVITTPFAASANENCLRSSGRDLGELEAERVDARRRFRLFRFRRRRRRAVRVQRRDFEFDLMFLAVPPHRQLDRRSGGVSATSRGSCRLRSIGLPS